MPSPGALAPPRLPVEDTYLELLADTLESLDLTARGQFLQRFLRAICHVELRESECVQVWDEMLTRRRALSDQAGRPVALKAALMDVLASSALGASMTGKPGRRIYLAVVWSNRISSSTTKTAGCRAALFAVDWLS